MTSFAFFDFDGTLICRDSFLILLKTGLKQQPWRVFFFLIFSPVFLATGLFHLNKTLAKSLLLWSLTVFRGKRQSLFFLQNSILQVADEIWFQEATEQLSQLKAQGIEIVIVSASGQCWIRALMRKKFTSNRMIIGSRLGFCLGGVVLKSPNCYEEEKITRIEAILGPDIQWTSAWSDHIADLPMLKKSQSRFIICPRKKHMKIFQQELGTDFTLLKWSVITKKS